MGDNITPKDPKISKKEYIIRFLKTVVTSIYPDSYKRFSERKILEGISYFFMVLGLSFIIALAVMGFKLFDIGQELEEELNKVNEFEIEFELSDDINFGFLRIAEEGNLTDEKILITKESITDRGILCILTPICFGEPKTSKFDDFDSYKDNITNFFNIMMIVLLPAITIVYTFLNGAAALVLCLLFTLIAKFFTKKLRISRRQIFLIAIYACTPLLILIPFSLIFKLYYLPLVLFFAFSIIGVLLVGEKKHRY